LIIAGICAIDCLERLVSEVIYSKPIIRCRVWRQLCSLTHSGVWCSPFSLDAVNPV